jgi:hypothetical protein
MRLLERLKRFLGNEEIDADARVEAETEAKRLAYDRDSIRVASPTTVPGIGGSMAPTPDNLHPERDER